MMQDMGVEWIFQRVTGWKAQQYEWGKDLCPEGGSVLEHWKSGGMLGQSLVIFDLIFSTFKKSDEFGDSGNGWVSTNWTPLQVNNCTV